MEYENFIEELKKYVLSDKEWEICEEDYKFYPDGCTANGDKKVLSFIRNTNIKYHQTESDVLIGDFVEIERKRDNGELICRFEVRYLFDEFNYDGWSRVRLIIDENLKMASCTDINEIVANMNDYNYIKDRLIIRPINYTDHRYELKDVIYKQCGDIALVLYVFLYDNEEFGLGTAKVPKAAYECWEKDIEEIWTEALINTNVIAPPRMYMDPADAYKPSYEMGAFMALNSKINSIGKMQVPLITTTKQRNGAIAMFYPGVQEKIAALMGSSYYIAFTSVDDARVHHIDSVSPLRALRSLKDVNKMSEKDDILSRKVYLYDKDKKTMEALEL